MVQSSRGTSSGHPRTNVVGELLHGREVPRCFEASAPFQGLAQWRILLQQAADNAIDKGSTLTKHKMGSTQQKEGTVQPGCQALAILRGRNYVIPAVDDQAGNPGGQDGSHLTSPKTMLPDCP